jgi:hypothetical protein
VVSSDADRRKLKDQFFTYISNYVPIQTIGRQALKRGFPAQAGHDGPIEQK